MKSNLALIEEHYQTTIYLNDRPYRVLDMGEGECSIIIVSCEEDYLKAMIRLSPIQRVIIVDISGLLNCEHQDTGMLEKALANDLHLLFDVFWLEEVKVHSEVSNLNMNAIYEVVRIRNHSRTLLNFEQRPDYKHSNKFK
ncbi:hypothetical protein VFDL14_22500 [Vibrio fortis]|uniref:Uncharacterized protein n=1 Tax=Vibrio fortis TaxID=212667 RepID=A0A066UPI1_9VIBR|nr:hypothetical protein [Vibrio fortis]KDN28985.1 hypothetical protein VFDL14_22500 [Vibrio fortis]